ncbi:MAG: ATP-dependent metalloprotease, partial [Pseudomonas sp.]
ALHDNIDKLHAMTQALMKFETIDAEQVDDIMQGREPREPKGWDDKNSGSGKTVKAAVVDSDVPTVGNPAGEH